MTLVASGQISIGGTPGTEVPSNSSIEAEIGGAFASPYHSTASLNDTPLRSLAGITGASTTISLSNFYGKSAGGFTSTYWITTLGGPINDYLRDVVVDGQGFVYAVGQYGGGNAIIVKYDNSGNVSWQRQLPANYYGIGIDSSSNLYAVGTYYSGRYISILVKYNSAGTVQWERQLGSTSYSSIPARVAVDGSGNVYMCGYTMGPTSSGQYDAYLAKYDSSGTIQWQRVFGGASNDYGYGVVVDSSSNIYMVTTSVASSGYGDPILVKYNSSGVIQWSRKLFGPSIDEGHGLAVDSSGNIYVVGYTLYSITEGLIAKYNSSGTIQWQRKLGGTGFNTTEFSDVYLDSSANIYVVGQTYTATLRDIIIIKYNSSGILQWQRKFAGSIDDFGNAVTLDTTNNNLYVVGTFKPGTYQQPTNYGSVTTDYPEDALIMKLPTDGTKTGTYSLYSPSSSGYYSMTYGTVSMTDAATSFTDSASGLTDAASTMSASTPTLTDSSITITSTRLVI